jgi:hypothetical protein
VTCTRDGNSVRANALLEIAPLEATKTSAIANARQRLLRNRVKVQNMFIAFLASIEATTAGTACIVLDRIGRRFVARTAQRHCDRIHNFRWHAPTLGRLRGDFRRPPSCAA